MLGETEGVKEAQPEKEALDVVESEARGEKEGLGEKVLSTAVSVESTVMEGEVEKVGAMGVREARGDTEAEEQLDGEIEVRGEALELGL
jgi:hypothetical protein